MIWLAAQERPAVLTEASVAAVGQQIYGKGTGCPAGDSSESMDTPPLLAALCTLRHRQFESSGQLIDSVEARIPGADGRNFVLTRERRDLVREHAEHLAHRLDSIPAAIGGSVTAVLTFFSLLSGSRFLGLTPLQALQGLLGFAGVRRFREETGFRQRFSTEFRLVSRSLPRHTHLTLILDDLDRCTPENVVRALEIVNLLVSAAPCYVLLGIDPARSTGGSDVFRPGAQPDTAAWWLLPAGLAVALLGIASGRRRWDRVLNTLPEIRQVERDTPEFARALDIWHPVVVALPQNNTPRAVKRFKNMVRYFAVRQRDLAAPRNLLERFLEPARRWMRPRYGAFADAPPIPEPLLVALGSIHHCDPHWIVREAAFEAVLQADVDRLQQEASGRQTPGAAPEDPPEPGVREALRGSLEGAIRDHRAQFPDAWPPTPTQRLQFLSMTARLRGD